MRSSLFCVGGPARFAVRVRARFPANLIISVSGREPRAGIFEKSSPVAATVRARFPANPLISVSGRELQGGIFEKSSPVAATVRARFSANPLFAVSGRLCPYNGVNSKIVLYLFLGGTALSGIKKSNLNLTMSKSMLGCASQAGTSGESATCHLAAA